MAGRGSWILAGVTDGEPWPGERHVLSRLIREGAGLHLLKQLRWEIRGRVELLLLKKFSAWLTERRALEVSVK